MMACAGPIRVTRKTRRAGTSPLWDSCSGEMSRHDVFSCTTLMGLAHAIIEGARLMLLIGAHIGGIFFLRLALAFVTCAVINILYLRFRGDARGAETAPNEVS